MSSSATKGMEIKTQIYTPPITKPIDEQNNDRQNLPKLVIGILTLLLIIAIGYYIIDSLIKPLPEGIPNRRAFR